MQAGNADEAQLFPTTRRSKWVWSSTTWLGGEPNSISWHWIKST